MTQILDSLPAGCFDSLLCSYVNSSPKVQIARISNIPGWYFERVVFPGQRLLFYAPTAAQLEIHTNTIASAILSDRIACRCLRVEVNDIDPDSDSAATQASPMIQQPVGSVVH